MPLRIFQVGTKVPASANACLGENSKLQTLQRHPLTSMPTVPGRTIAPQQNYFKIDRFSAGSSALGAE